jgi:hypothetical protein
VHYLTHVSNGLSLAAYLVKDILWLRVMALVAIFISLVNNWTDPSPNAAAIAWNITFSAINLVQVKILLQERRPVKFSEEAQELYRNVFRTLTPHEFKKLLTAGEWRNAAAGERIVARGEVLDRVMVLVTGAASVRVDGERVAGLEAGHFIGEMSFLTGADPTADVVLDEPARLVAWPKDALKKLLDKHAELRSQLQMIIGTDLVNKLKPRKRPARAGAEAQV